MTLIGVCLTVYGLLVLLAICHSIASYYEHRAHKNAQGRIALRTIYNEQAATDPDFLLHCVQQERKNG